MLWSKLNHNSKGVPININTVRALLCFGLVWHWPRWAIFQIKVICKHSYLSFRPAEDTIRQDCFTLYPFGMIWFMITPKPVKQPWRTCECEYMNTLRATVYPKKYAHGFVVLCFVVVMQSFIMNSHEVFIHIHQGCFAGTGAIVRLPQCQGSKPDGYGKISQCITTTKHSKAKTVCIFLGIYCIY